ncbi:single-stranded-DNA-specific exonuclease [Fontimonas thermophila]|uniref:Single-stranded-DNA-specific exonuclease RecJ n=1 Tax=Fontimonas thermophila TaxID=1076937 RepID=A0A1I2IV72_9GAMM|nr:single-stranded-DNA-specific exonuclease RecJ [Fontimonas thermophila]SFF44917.1 single-stranded-DNA-specific exonuclease [Fontimonas thermophila]
MAGADPVIRRRAAGDPERLPSSLHPVLRRVYAARGVQAHELSLTLSDLLPPSGLLGIDAAAARLADAIERGEGIVVAGDYDADGATATAVAVLGLRALGAADVHYVVPDRFRMGYGLSPALAQMAAATGARVLVTVDNGIASLAGVETARALGLAVIVTDHHLPGPELPAADAIVNPNQPGCRFASKALSGVGTMFYVLLAVRAELRRRGAFAVRPQPHLAELLDLVAIGTVADVVRLDHNNRILVEQGLRRIRAGRMRPGIEALLRCAGRQATRLDAQDLGFALAPRINAAGRLDDMRIGIACLLAPDLAAAQPLAETLDRFNRERRDIQEQMQLDAQALIEDAGRTGLCLFHPDWHEGVVGLVASRIKELHHRPTIAFARAQQEGELKGSGRSIPGLHLRDVLAAIDARHPGLILRFGGHAMAAGLTLKAAHLAEFAAAFDATCAAQLDEVALERLIETDGPLDAHELNLDTARALEQGGPWGQGFAEPLFEGTFEVVEARGVGSEGAHVRYRLRHDGGLTVTAIDFGGASRLCANGRVAAVYALSVDRHQGSEALNLRIVHLRPL